MATIYTLQVNKYIRLAITYKEYSLAGSMILLLQMWGHSMVACNDEQIKHWKCNSGIINEMIYFKEGLYRKLDFSVIFLIETTLADKK